MIEFEFGEEKSQSNLRKHGIDFLTAQSLWDDPDFVEIKAKSEDEPGFLVIGLLDATRWSAVTTMRHGNVRIISVRRSGKAEVPLYESQRLR